jgi:hypothetical protein
MKPARAPAIYGFHPYMDKKFFFGSLAAKTLKAWLSSVKQPKADAGRRFCRTEAPSILSSNRFHLTSVNGNQVVDRGHGGGNGQSKAGSTTHL